MLKGIPCTWMRGGTSKGAYFLASDLPEDQQARDKVLLAVMGSPDERQIDGMGGANPLTSKVAIVSRSAEPGVDVDYLFAQVFVEKPQVSYAQNCGNILAGIGPFAIEHGLVQARDGRTDVTIRMVNSNDTAIATIATPGGKVAYEGDAQIDGVPGTAAPVMLDFPNTAGSLCGALLPTGNVADQIDGITVTCIDNGMPVIAMKAGDLGVTGYESVAELEANAALKERLEAIRLEMGPKMNLGDVAEKSVPKMFLLAPPRSGGVVCTRSFIPHRVHSSIGVFAATTVATACLLEGSPAHEMAELSARKGERMDIEHPSGFMSVAIEVEQRNGSVEVKRSAFLRTARKLFEGTVFVPE